MALLAPIHDDEDDGGLLFPDVVHPKKRAYLVALSICGRVGMSAKSAGVARQVVNSPAWAEDPEFQAGVAKAMAMFAHVLEEEAIRRAVDGDREYQFTAQGAPKRHPEECVCGHNAREHLRDPQTQERFAGPCAGTGVVRGGGDGLTGPEGTGEAHGASLEVGGHGLGCSCEAYLGAPYYVDKRSDTMLIFTMKGMMPEKYGDRVELRGALAGLDISRLPHAIIARLAAGENPLQVLASSVEETVQRLTSGAEIVVDAPAPSLPTSPQGATEPAPRVDGAGPESSSDVDGESD